MVRTIFDIDFSYIIISILIWQQTWSCCSTSYVINDNQQSQHIEHRLHDIRFSPMSHPYHTHKHMLGFQNNVLHMSNYLMVFYTLTDTYHVPFSSWVTFPTIKLRFTLTWDMFCECLWFIYLFDHIKYFQVHIFHFIRKIYSTGKDTPWNFSFRVFHEILI